MRSSSIPEPVEFLFVKCSDQQDKALVWDCGLLSSGNFTSSATKECESRPEAIPRRCHTYCRSYYTYICLGFHGSYSIDCQR
jgi:hypothetical protein